MEIVKKFVNDPNSYEQFLRDRGCRYKTEPERAEAYARRQKAIKGEVLSESEFIAEVSVHKGAVLELAKAAYARLAELYSNNRLSAHSIYQYAYYGWCLNKPESIIIQQVAKDQWVINSCCDEISIDEAIDRIADEWGFSKQDLMLIGTPYYTATDYQFIRFDCRSVTWLWANGELYQVYV